MINNIKVILIVVSGVTRDLCMGGRGGKERFYAAYNFDGIYVKTKKVEKLHNKFKT